MLFLCLPTTPADCNLFNNHRKKIVVGGNYNVLVYYKNASAPDPEGAVLCKSFKWDIYIVIHFDQKSCCLYRVPSTTADCNLFNNHRNKKALGGNYNILVYYKNASAPDPEGAVLCNTFK